MLSRALQLSSARKTGGVGCLLLLCGVCFHTLTQGCERESGKEESANAAASPTTVRLKIGALFDVRARHLTEAFQTAVRVLNMEQREDANAHDTSQSVRDDATKIRLEPVITFVDIRDSFAVSNAMCDLIANDVIAIVGVTNASSLPTIQSYSATFHVPFLSLGSAQNVTSSAPFQLSLRPPVMAAVVDLVHHQGCGSALYLYDSDEGLMRIQDLFQAINFRELYLELDVRRIGEKGHVTEISKIIGSLSPRREICLILDVERLDAVSVVTMFADAVSSIKDIVLVTMDSDMLLGHLLHESTKNRPLGFKSFNVSGLQLVPSHLNRDSWADLHHHSTFRPSFAGWRKQGDDHDSQIKHNFQGYQQRRLPSHLHRDLERSTQKVDADFPEEEDRAHLRRRNPKSSSTDNEDQEDVLQHDKDLERLTDFATDIHSNEENPFQDRSVYTYYTDDDHLQTKLWNTHQQKASRGGWLTTSEALISDCLKVVLTALKDLWETLGDVIESGSDVTQEDLSIKCTNFVVEKKQYGAELMKALRLVHFHGETRYISFDTSGKREEFTLSVLSIKAGTGRVSHEGEWSSISGMMSQFGSREGVRSYTVFGNMSGGLGRRRVLLGVIQ